MCLPWGRESDNDITGRLVTLTGWGDTQFRQFHLIYCYHLCFVKHHIMKTKITENYGRIIKWSILQVASQALFCRK